jgi:hypothetical protein
VRNVVHPVAATAEWWTSLARAVDELAYRYPRTYGVTIPAAWRDDSETVELLAAITGWRRELDHQDAEQGDDDVSDLEMRRLPASGLERARQEWEWHAHRDQWLARLAETGRAPLGAATATPAD